MPPHGDDASTADTRHGSPAAAPPLRVGVLVDLLWSPKAGGHVKFWERAAQGAVALDGLLDLTIHFAAEADGEHAVSPHVRYRLLRPAFGTQRLPFLSHIPDHTDLARFHRRLARELPHYDVIHTTDAYFAYARTAARIARRRGIPLVNSVHTDTPGYTRLYTAETIRRIVGRGWLAHLLIDRLHLDRRAERGKLDQLRRHQRDCAFVFGPRDADLDLARSVLPTDRVQPLPRGLDLAGFNPRWRDRAWLEAQYGLAPGTPAVLCVGRVNAGKNTMMLARAMATLAGRGAAPTLICAGEGEDRDNVLALLGTQARCPGAVVGEDLFRLMASADLLAHPSEVETFGNVVSEGMAAGLPALVHAEGPPRDQIVDGVTGIAVPRGEDNWAAAIAALLDDGPRRRRMGVAARAAMEARFADWTTVVAERFLPVWRRAAGRPAAPTAA